MTWWKRFIAWLRKPKPREILVTLTPEDFVLFHWWSGQSGQSIEVLVSTAASQGVPKPIRATFNRQKSNESMFAHIEAIDDLAYQASLNTGAFSFPPEARIPSPLPVSSISQETLKRRLQINHPCIHLDEGDLTQYHLRPGEAQGLCNSPQRSKVPCHWPPSVSPSCSYYQSKTTKKRV